MTLYMVTYESWTGGYGSEPMLLGVYSDKTKAEEEVSKYVQYITSNISTDSQKEEFLIASDQSDKYELREYLRPKITDIEMDKTYSIVTDGYHSGISNGTDFIPLGGYVE